MSRKRLILLRFFFQEPGPKAKQMYILENDFFKASKMQDTFIHNVCINIKIQGYKNVTDLIQLDVKIFFLF